MKIIYKHSNLDTAYNYNRIFTMVKYGVAHLEEVKKTQGKIITNSYENSKVSITTIDPNLIKSIPTEQFNFNPQKALKRRNVAFPISIFAALIGAFVAIFAGTAAKRKNAKT